MKYVGVIVLYYPDNEKLLSNIETYIKYLDKLYVIDNTPEQNNIKLFKKNKKIIYYSYGKNLGMAKALNVAANKAIEDGYNWLLTMDQDSYFQDNSIINLFKYIENNNTKNIAIVSPKHNTKLIDNNHIGKNLVVMTSGNLLNLSLYKKIGGFDEKLFIDCVDFDYCLKSRIMNYSIHIVKDSILNHNLGNIERKKWFGKMINITNHSPIRRYYITRNRLYIHKKYHLYFPKFCKQELKNTRNEIFKIIFFENQKFKKIFYVILGTLDYYRKKEYALYEKK